MPPVGFAPVPGSDDDLDHAPTDVDATPEPGLGTMLRRGMLRRCPACGEATMFRSWFAMHDRCATCGLDFHREHGQVLGGVTLNLVITLGAMLTVFLFFAIVTWPDVPVGLLAAITLGICVVFPIAFLPSSRGAWIALDQRLQR